MAYQLIHEPSGKVIVPHLEVANTLLTRTRGLLGRDSLPLDRALWIESCNSIHTCFMKFPLDVVYVDSEGKVIKIVLDIRPWKFSISWGASSVIEWQAGALKQWDVKLGDKLIQKKGGAESS